MAQLHDAHRQVDAILWAIDSGLLGPPPDKDRHAADPPDAGIGPWLLRRAGEPIPAIVDELRANLAHEALRLVPDPVPETVAVAVTDDPQTSSPLQATSQQAGLYLADPNLLIPDPPAGRYR